MDFAKNTFEIYETPDGAARFYFSHSDENMTTGVLVMQSGAALPKHNRPLGLENLVQISGKSQMTVFETDNPDEIEKTIDLEVDDELKMKKGQWHIHANPYDVISLTFFKLVGDITEIMQVLRDTNKKVEQKQK